MKRIFWLAGIASAGLLTQTLSATVIGTGSEANCGGGGVTVTATAITWSPTGSGGANTGCITTGLGTDITYTGGSILSNVTGYVADEPGAPPLPFIVLGPLSFQLTNNFNFNQPVGYQGVGVAACTTASATAGDSCTISGNGGSATPDQGFLLTYEPDGSTTIDLFAAGTVADPVTSALSSWTATFSTNFAATTPLAIYNDICPTIACTGNVQSTQSANLNVTATATPEPGSISMMLLGGMLIMGALAKKVKKA